MPTRTDFERFAECCKENERLRAQVRELEDILRGLVNDIRQGVDPWDGRSGTPYWEQALRILEG